jgi:Fibronectin type III domain/Divergent InlB B-repeat domain
MFLPCIRVSVELLRIIFLLNEILKNRPVFDTLVAYARLLSLCSCSWAKVLSVASLLIFSPSFSEAAQPVRLAWDPNPEPDDYILRYGTRAGQPTWSLEVSKKTTAAVSDLEDGTTYYFTVVARNSRGVESPPSNEVSFTTETPTVIGSSSVSIGETNVLGTADFGNGNLLIAQRANLTDAATIRSLSFYVTEARGKLRLGIFDATGRNGGPGKKKAETAETTPKVGWNTANVTIPISLPKGPYWLAYLASDNNLALVKTRSGLAKYYAYPYGPMPTTFFSSPNTEVVHWSLFASLNTPGIQLPTHTLVVLNGTGSGRYAQGKQIQVSATPPASGKRFDGWARDWQILTNPFIPTTTALMLSRDLTIEATYASVRGK